MAPRRHSPHAPTSAARHQERGQKAERTSAKSNKRSPPPRPDSATNKALDRGGRFTEVLLGVTSDQVHLPVAQDKCDTHTVLLNIAGKVIWKAIRRQEF